MVQGEPPTALQCHEVVVVVGGGWLKLGRFCVRFPALSVSPSLSLSISLAPPWPETAGKPSQGEES